MAVIEATNRLDDAPFDADDAAILMGVSMRVAGAVETGWGELIASHNEWPGHKQSRPPGQIGADADLPPLMVRDIKAKRPALKRGESRPSAEETPVS